MDSRRERRGVAGAEDRGEGEGRSPPEGMEAALARARDVLKRAHERQDKEREEQRRRLDAEEEERRRALEKLNEEKERRKREKEQTQKQQQAVQELQRRAVVEAAAHLYATHAVTLIACQHPPTATQPPPPPVSVSEGAARDAGRNGADVSGGRGFQHFQNRKSQHSSSPDRERASPQPWTKFRDTPKEEAGSRDRALQEANKYLCDEPPPSSSTTGFSGDEARRKERIIPDTRGRESSPTSRPCNPRHQGVAKDSPSDKPGRRQEGASFETREERSRRGETRPFEKPQPSESPFGGEGRERLARFQGRLPLGPNFAKEEWKEFLNWQSSRMQARAAVSFDPGRIWTEERTLSPTRWRVATGSSAVSSAQTLSNPQKRGEALAPTEINKNGAESNASESADQRRDAIRHAQMTDAEIAHEKAWREKLQEAESGARAATARRAKKKKRASSKSSNSSDEDPPTRKTPRPPGMTGALLEAKVEERDAEAEIKRRQLLEKQNTKLLRIGSQQQRLEGSTRESAKALAAALGLPEFEKSSVYKGSRHGAVFKTGDKGLGYYLDSHALVSLFAETKATTVEEAVERLMKAGGPQASRRELKEDISNRLMQNKRSRSASRSASGSRKKSKKSKKDRKKQKSKKKHKKEKKKRKRRHSSSSSSSSASESDSDLEDGDAEDATSASQANVAGVAAVKTQRPNVAVLEAALAEQQAAIAAGSEGSSSEDETAGPRPMEVTSKLASKNVDYGFALRPGEGEAIAQFVQEGKRIPRRGEVGLTADEIAAFESLGYVMSGSRHRRMNAIRIRKENQVYSAEEQRALAMLNYEERAARETQLIADLREMLKKQNEALFSEEVEQETA